VVQKDQRSQLVHQLIHQEGATKASLEALKAVSGSRHGGRGGGAAAASSRHEAAGWRAAGGQQGAWSRHKAAGDTFDHPALPLRSV
jgi:hypothetical protein